MTENKYGLSRGVDANGFRAYAPIFFSPRGRFRMVKDILKSEIVAGKTIYPRNPLRAIKEVPFYDVRVVILGQDPYHNGLADGLAFSTLPHNPVPQSLKRIFREYADDLGYPIPSTGDLSDWAKRGVLLLNTSLTVEAGKPGSHYGIGWWHLAREVFYRLDEAKKGVVFILWGQHAKKFADIPDRRKHLVLEHCHPSPFTGDEWHQDNKCFSKACDYMGLDKEFWKLR